MRDQTLALVPDHMPDYNKRHKMACVCSAFSQPQSFSSYRNKTYTVCSQLFLVAVKCKRKERRKVIREENDSLNQDR